MIVITCLYQRFTSLGKGEVSGSSPDEGMSKSIAAKEISRKKDLPKGGRPLCLYGPKTFPT